MNNKKPYVYKRVIAYFIDLIIVALLSGILTVVFTDDDKANDDSKAMIELMSKYQAGEIEKEDYYREYQDLSYSIDKNSIVTNSIIIGVSIVYFVVLCYYCHGITLGKYLVKIKIVSANDKDLNIFHYLLRSLIVDLILSRTFGLIMVNVLSKADYIKYHDKVSNVFTILLLVSFILIMYRDDGRGIEDFMGNTKIVNIKDVIDNNRDFLEVNDAKIVKEKKEVK